MASFLRFLLCCCLVLPASAATPFWTPIQAQMRQWEDPKAELTWGQGAEAWKVRLEASRERAPRLWITPGEGRTCREIPCRSETGVPFSPRAFCVRDRPGEDGPSGASDLDDALEEGQAVPVPVGTATVGAWKLWLVQWDTMGCGIAGCFSTSLLIARHQPSGAWCAKIAFGQGFEALPDPRSPTPCFTFVGAERTSNNCWIREPWRMEAAGGRARVAVGRASYRWFCSELVADTPRRARHWGHQEVAWHLRTATAEGGEAEAFAPSPRAKESFDGLFPAPGRQAFHWRSLVVAAGTDGRRRFLDARQAYQLARQGGWDVVLEARNGQPTATWLVKHDRDFPHSTPRH